MSNAVLKNYINGEWRLSSASDRLPVHNPATAQVLAEVPLSPGDEVNQATAAAAQAFLAWRRVPAVERVQPLFRLKGLLEAHADELARLITQECGKTLKESRH